MSAAAPAEIERLRLGTCLGFAVIPARIFVGNALCAYLYDLDERKLHDGPV